MLTVANSIMALTDDARYLCHMSGSQRISLSQLLNMPRVVQATLAAREDIDALLWRRDVRAAAADVAHASISRGGTDSAALEGADLVGIEASPMGRVLAASLFVTGKSGTYADTWRKTPVQVITGLHSCAAIDFVSESELARPRTENTADDPLKIGALPSAAECAPALITLAKEVTTIKNLPALIEAGYVHAELMRLRPFTWGSGLVARAVIRTIIASRGLDPSNFSIPENGMYETGRTNYVNAIRAYISGTPEGIEQYFEWFSVCIGLGARAVRIGSIDS